ncbi:hypothetical protein ACWEQD_12210 [Rhodococcus pyridinivorans]
MKCMKKVCGNEAQPTPFPCWNWLCVPCEIEMFTDNVSFWGAHPDGNCDCPDVRNPQSLAPPPID